MQKNKNRPGYKKTILGWIPEDWSGNALRDVALVQGGFAFPSKSFLNTRHQYQVIRMGNVYQGNLSLDRTPVYLDTISPTEEAFLLKGNDIVMSLTGTLGKRDFGFAVKILPKHANLLLNQRLCRIRGGETVDQSFLFYFLLSPRFQDQFFNLSYGGTGNQANVGIIDLQSMLISKPSLPEQEAIAEVLECWDKAIRGYEQKIEKKRNIKKGLMQRLLSGKQRLPGFDGEWKEVRLGEVLHEHREKSTGGEEVHSVSVHKGLINQIEHLGRSFAAADTSNYNLVKPGDVVYTKSPTGDFPLGIIKQSRLSQNVIVSPLYGVFTPMTVHLGLMLDCFFESSVNTGNYLRPIIQKGAKNTINITNKTFLSNNLFLPLCPEEQRAIALVFSCLENDIAALEQKLAALREQKRFLLNNMVTGTIRLPEFRNTKESNS